MSFILDALKKSESDRQQHGPAEFASVPTSNGRQGAPRWLWVLGVLLAVNLVVLIGLLLRPDVAVTPAASVQVATDNDSFAEQVAQARQNIPPREEPRTDASRPAATGSTSAPVTTMPAAVRASRIFCQAPGGQHGFAAHDSRGPRQWHGDAPGVTCRHSRLC